MRRLKRAIPVAVIVLGAVTLTACSSGSDSSTTTASKDFVIGWDSVEGIDQIQVKGSTAGTVTANVYAPILEQQYKKKDGYLDGTTTYSPLLGDVTKSEGGKLVTIKLKPGVTFADGDPITADDVVYTFQRTLGDGSYVSGSSRVFMHITNPATQVVKIDDRTVQVTLDSPSTAFDHFLALNTFGIVEKSVAEKNATAEDPWAKAYFWKNATASGPFIIKSSNDQKVVLTKNKDYVDADKVFAKSVTIENIADTNQRLLAVESGDIDMAFGLSPRQAKQAESNGDVDVLRIPTTTINYLGMNNSIAPFDNKTFREAIVKAIPYDTILNKVMLGSAHADYGAVPYGMETSDAPNAKTGASKTDTAAAKKLLAESGVTDPTITLSVNSSNQADVDTATYVQSALKGIGVTVNIEKLSSADYTTKKSAKGLAFFFDSWFSWGEDPFYQMRALFLTDRATNPTKYSNSVFDSTVLKGITESNAATRQSLSSTAQQLLLDDAPAAFLYTSDEIVVVHKGVSGITAGDDLLTRLKYLTRK